MSDDAIIIDLAVIPGEELNPDFNIAPTTYIERQGFDGGLILTCIVTIVAAAIPSIIDIVYDMRKNKKLRRIEYKGMSIEVDSDEDIEKVLTMLRETQMKEEQHDHE